jgi:peptidoglycan/xylan/chitin deacetylase (PgdA/CDA1 family)
MGRRLYELVFNLDRFIAKAQGNRWERRGSLVNLFFHGLFRDDAELRAEAAYPQQATTVADFDFIIRYLLEREYQFVSPEQLAGGLDPNKRYACLTFDDGYYNNVRALPVLEKHNVPIVVFVSAGHVWDNKGFWWEALYAARRREGRPLQQILLEMAQLNSMRTPEIEAYVRRDLGTDDLKARGEADRPFTKDELREFGRHRLISIGNHTMHHAVLTAYSEQEALREISEAQEVLGEITGRKPVAIAYPNGRYSTGVVQSAKAAGLQIGFSAKPRKEYLPEALQGERRLTLGRFCPYGTRDLAAQCEAFRSDWMLSYRFDQLKRPFKAY